MVCLDSFLLRKQSVRINIPFQLPVIFVSLERKLYKSQSVVSMMRAKFSDFFIYLHISKGLPDNKVTFTSLLSCPVARFYMYIHI